MAIIHQATLTPTKPALVAVWLDGQSWAGAGDTEVVGSYRFDDPAGEVGVEAMIVRRGEQVHREHTGDDQDDQDAEADESRLVLVRVIDGPVDGPDRLLATWPGGQGVVAALG